MTSLHIHAALGALTVGAVFFVNTHSYEERLVRWLEPKQT